MGGLAEIIEHDRSGVLVDVSIDASGLARIDPHALAEAIVDLVDNDEKAMRYREAGRSRAAEFSGARMAELTLQAYRSMSRRTASPG
jgi:glycosyltransferase involved in cell wall biosynthesis